MLSGVGVRLLFRVSGSRTICCMTIPFVRRIRPFKLATYPSSDRSGSTSHRIGLDLLTLTETQTLLRGSGYNKCTIKTSAAPSKQLVTKCGKCLCSGVKRRIGEVRVKSDRGGRRKEWRHLETEADE